MHAFLEIQKYVCYSFSIVTTEIAQTGLNVVSIVGELALVPSVYGKLVLLSRSCGWSSGSIVAGCGDHYSGDCLAEKEYIKK